LDTYTKEETNIYPSELLQYSHLFEQIKSADKTVTCTEIFPKKIRPNGALYFSHQCRRILKQSRQQGSQFILAYWPEPDHTCHHQGTYTFATKNKLNKMNNQIKELCAQLTDSLVIISADHGHIPIKDFFYIDEYPDFESCFKTPLTLDDRVSAVFLKQGKEQRFLDLFNTYLKDDFFLMKSTDALEQGLFGTGKENPYMRDFLGDYLIIGIGHRALRQRIPNARPTPEFKSSHAGLSPQEMLVPLITIRK
jgi:predicted AlkP superfamily pyrophosphatase or phosphodiesterase